MDTIRILVLTGTIGAGKTTIAEAVSDLLHQRGIRHALIDLDWLGQVYPVPEGHEPYGYQLALTNLAVMWPNFIEAGITHAVIAGTVLDLEQLERLSAAAPGADPSVYLVVAPSEVVKARIGARTSGPLLEDFLARTDSVADQIAAARIHDGEVLNDDRDVQEIANALLRRLGW